MGKKLVYTLTDNLTESSSKVGKDFRDKGLTVSQFSVLDVLYTKGEMRICELIKKVLSTSGNMTVVIKNMEQRGWLYRNISETDKRAFIVGLTEKGKNCLKVFYPNIELKLKKHTVLLPLKKKSS
ncbi:MarR family winged helix-turn-helix transcriptional regulator [Pseudoleptotrichia goodfellowii]|uniref:Transcriptional regulator, MarR family n=1 Tax=Pseudoleptotrichia goodfellowii TaxID=157692 RepID=A0A510JBW5_9FUSO|nr:MarR family transcriptional regulator [Pseudoleptotrichia goodfellowii]BBM36684.1 transcriptional regulator, MarR family [Pseudoleptotrichia goodfellowii]